MSECLECGRQKQLDPEGLCRKCQGLRGFRFCYLCAQKRLRDLDFHPGRAECRECSSKRRRMDLLKCARCGVHHKNRCPQLRTCRWCKRGNDAIAFHTPRVCIECSVKTLDELRAAKKNRRCAICNETEGLLGMRPLCVRCRAGLDCFGSSPELLLRAFDYTKGAL